MLRLCVCIALALSARLAHAQVELAPPHTDDPIVISADQASTWKEGSYNVWLLRGRCVVKQGFNTCRAQDAVLWIKSGNGTVQKPSKVIAYLEGDVQIEAGRKPELRQAPLPNKSERGWLGRFYSSVKIEIHTPRPRPEPPVKPAVWANAVAARNPDTSNLTHTQFRPASATAAASGAAASGAATGAADGSAAAAPALRVRQLRIFQRGDLPPHVEWKSDQATDEGVAVITGGVQILIDGLPQVGQLDIVADKVVLWTVGRIDAGVQEKFQDEEIPLEVYMEGNVVFRQQDRVVYADRMYYDVKHNTGTVLGAEITSPVPKFGGQMRLKADLVRQIDENTFVARNSYFTTSRMARPRYRVQSQEIRVYDRQRRVVNPFTGVPQRGPNDEEVIEHDQMVSAKNNLMFAGPVPVFYWPKFSTNLEEPSTLLAGAYFQYDKIFGLWTEAEVDAYQLLGIENEPEGLDWTFTVSDLTKRGFGGGTDLLINRSSFFGLQGRTEGYVNVWGLDDHGLDNLGYTRMNITHPGPFRGRIFGQFRQQLQSGFQLTGELAKQSDYNFLEQYYEAEFDQHKDETTDIELKKYDNNTSYSAYGQVRLNPFFTQTNWLPRLDHYMSGTSLLGDRITWYEHTNVGYGQFERIGLPPDPQDLQHFQFLPWELSGSHQGDRVATRHEIDAPFELGPVKVVPYAEGELAQWGQDLNNADVGRAFGQAGIRSSVMFWASNPNVESNLFNLHGLAHKVVFDVDASASDANRRVTSLVLYDPVQDNAQYRFERRFMSLDYGGTLPLKYDPRIYDLRAGLQNFVSSPSTEIADRFAAVRLGMRNRLQTKRGPVGHRRIVDYMVLDTSAVYFPNPNRDNFGAPWGMIFYDFRWHVGDRLTVLSDGGYDFFAGGQRTYSVGATLSRPPRINLYLGIRSLNGPFTYNVLTFSQSYQLSPKWLISLNTQVPLGKNRNIGENFTFTRVGESFITSIAAYVDGGKNNAGVNFMVQPRFLGQTMLSRIGGANVPLTNPNMFE
ncbi:MAG TPA: hypothetical protein VF306_18675 [Pirellulales bacterium]